MLTGQAEELLPINLIMKDFLKEKDGIYTGLYPKELIINNTPVNFGGTLFAMAPLPHEEDEYRIKTRAIHSSFSLLSRKRQELLRRFFNIKQYG